MAQRFIGLVFSLGVILGELNSSHALSAIFGGDKLKQITLRASLLIPQ